MPSRFPYLLICCLLMAVLVGCALNRKIQPQQVGRLKIGNEMPGIEKKRINGQLWKDTLFSENGYTWEAIRLVYPDGPVWVEGGFFGEQQINRIRIESSRLTYRKDLKVGDSMGDLLALGAEWEMTYLPAFGLLDLAQPDQPSVHFLLEDRDHLPEFWLSDTVRWQDIPLEAKIRAIVVM